MTTCLLNVLGAESKAVNDTGLFPPPLLRANVLVGVGLTGSRQAGTQMNKTNSDLGQSKEGHNRGTQMGGGRAGMKGQRRSFPGGTIQAETGGLTGRKGKEQ